MIIYRKELKRDAGTWCMWAFSLIFIQSFICIFLFPEVKLQISKVNNAIENAKEITAALGMAHLRLDKITDFYGCIFGMVFGIGGGLFAAIKGIQALEVEEEENTAGLLLSHPISRGAVLAQKLFSLFTQVAVLNAAAIGMGLITAKIIHETFEMHDLILLHISYFFMQLEIVNICFGISAFIRKGGCGIGAAFAAILYVMDLLHNVSEKADFLKYITPYAYCGAGRIFSQSKIQVGLIGIGIAMGLGGVIAACLKYIRKDILVSDQK